MTLDEAIEILSSMPQYMNYPNLADKRDAIKLGREALKRTKKEREIQGGLYNFELPGETKD